MEGDPNFTGGEEVLVPEWGDPSLITGQQGPNGENQQQEGQGEQAGVDNGAIVPGSSFDGGYDSGAYTGDGGQSLPGWYQDIISGYQDAISGN